MLMEKDLEFASIVVWFLLPWLDKSKVKSGTYRKPRLRDMDQIVKDMGCKTYGEMKRKAERREEWRSANLTAANQSMD
ncbi:MAG: hypothetical protein ACEY3F_04455 [Wolbachia sp.]